MSSKEQLIDQFIERKTKAALYRYVGQMNDRVQAETIRQNITQICFHVSMEVSTEYSFLELADIMEWKRTRVRK